MTIGATDIMLGYRAPGILGDVPAGTVRISPEKQQLIGVQFGEAAEMNIAKTIRAVGRAAYDETGGVDLQSQDWRGWIQERALRLNLRS